MEHREIRHTGLNKHKVITGRDPQIVAAKAALQVQAWEEEYRRKLAADEEQKRRAALDEKQRYAKLEAKEREKQAKQAAKDAIRQEAADRTAEAQAALNHVRAVLPAALGEKHVVAWESLKQYRPFEETEPARPSLPAPTKPQLPPASPKPVLPPEPRFAEPHYEHVRLGILDKLITSRRERRVSELAEENRNRRAEAQQKHDEAVEHWKRHCAAETSKWQKAMEARRQAVARAGAKYEAEVEAHSQRVLEENAKHAEQVEQWKQRAAQHAVGQEQENSWVDDLAARYLEREPAAVAEYCQLVVMRSEYPFSFKREYQVDYNPDTEILIVDFRLPTMDDLPTLKEVKYVQSRDELVESNLSERDVRALYDGLLYQIALRTIYELSDSDVTKCLKAVVFNGWVWSIDKATGQETHCCIMSIETQTEPFMGLNLASVDPKACFKSLKGLASPQLSSLTPVAPVLNINREDARFVASHDVSQALDEGYNLAAMDWEDFEHLIRELFAQEFSQSGGEVKVTQASRDGGVDAVAFDPDPIRGGKIVIQAKRYTNVVGVSAVRDLYGTVMNEGATKGILVTTSDYGPDAHEFAKGKPLTLLTGNNLLHLLAKHGHQAKIDIMEAKQLMAEREK